jgi:membrane-bound serine protease (ClpP class)
MMDVLAQTLIPEVAENASPIIWAFVFIGIALVLFVVEIFVPSSGLIALIGTLSVIASLIAFYIHSVNTGLIATLVYIVFGPAIFWIAFRIWAASPLASRMILGGVVEEDPDEAKQRSIARQQDQRAYLESFVGKHGTTITVLRPIGVVRIDGERIDAMAETGIIEANCDIKVTSVYDNQVKVRAVSPQE